MNLTRLGIIPQKRYTTDVFGGYDRNLRISDGSFSDMENMSSDFYPVASPRKKRGTFDIGSGTHRINGITAKDALCYVDGTYLYINGYKVAALTLEDSPKELISMGAYLIIMPDKKYVNTANLTDCGDIEAEFSSSGTVTFSLSTEDGKALENVTVSLTPPASPTANALWLDTSQTPHTLKEYSAENAVWLEMPCYVKIKANGIGALFSVGDGVTFSGIVTEDEGLKRLEGSVSVLKTVLHDGDTPANDFIVVSGTVDGTKTQSASLTVGRLMPALDFVIESGNRLWGCRYGIDASGNVVNEIYASKLGDFKNWNSFEGISTDSYVASCGTDGAFTGAICHLGYPLFFKENCLHKIYGSYPSNFNIQTTPCRGVAKGASASLAIVNETLYYKSSNGVCAYDGSLPKEVSVAFGEERFSGVDGTDPLRNGAVAGAYGNKYYLSAMSELDGKWHFLVYDTARRLWHKEDKTRAFGFASARGEMYFIADDRAKILTVSGSGITDKEPVRWMVETGILGTDMTGKKYVSGLKIRLQLPVGARVMMFIEYDSGGTFEHVATVTGKSLRSFTACLRPKRCDHFRLRLEGVGEAKIWSLSRVVYEGSGE